MATQPQIDANRRNAQMSTGPRTTAGKNASSRNAVKHNLSGSTFAILPGEDVDAFERLARAYREEWKPNTEQEIFLVNTMVQSRWRLDRIARMEAEAFDQLLRVPLAEGKSDEGALVALYPLRGDLLDKLHRYAQQHQRAYHRAVKELQQYRRAQAQENKRPALARPAVQNEPDWGAAPAPQPAPPPFIPAFDGSVAATAAIQAAHGV
jgi:hypothetical protein